MHGVEPDVCREAYAPVGTARALGEPCGVNGDVCDSSLICFEQEGCSRCERYRPIGQSCTYDFHCEGNLVCVGGQCTTAIERNASCTSTDQCRGFLKCLGAAGARICTDARTEGQPCDYDCQSGLECTGTPLTCHSANHLAARAPCTRTDTEPDCWFTCNFASPNDATGTCGGDFSPPAGEPCAYSGSYASCDSGAYADETTSGTTVTGCLCQPRRTPGTSCVGNECLTTCNVAAGTCAAFAVDGASCLYDRECASGYCANRICATPAACN
jgi:hypothetical protein